MDITQENRELVEKKYVEDQLKVTPDWYEFIKSQIPQEICLFWSYSGK